ncbi:lipoprotein [Geomonas silvestris]|uniref:Lipoprotein n=2 Tax=Geomonas silvestris TaxID=2740184 RepID=A0A6V8MGT3_9BACT|nr:lipoprotein [Geomonas silvestris]
MAGCGGSGGTTGSTGAPAGSSPAAVSGKVADGYLVNATVFMDKNGNYQPDAGEPTATTDPNGNYILTVDPADVGQYPIVAMAVQGVTIDKDTNQTVANSYILSMPAGAVSGTVSSNFISPMSTEIHELMATGKYSMQQAMDLMSAQLGLPAGTNMLADYMANSGSATGQTMHTAAQNMANLMGSQMGQVMMTSGSGTSVDVNRYRGMMGAIFSNLSSVKGTGAGSQTAMTTLMGSMTSTLGSMPVGAPFRNMSASFRGMMGGSTSGGTMMGSGTGGTTGSTSGGTMMGSGTGTTGTASGMGGQMK